MKFIFLLFTITLGYPAVAVRSSHVQRSRAKRDLIGYNRQRNTAYQSRLKMPDTNHMERYKRKIAEFVMTKDQKALRRFRKRLMVLEKQRRAKMLKQLGY